MDETDSPLRKIKVCNIILNEKTNKTQSHNRNRIFDSNLKTNINNSKQKRLSHSLSKDLFFPSITNIPIIAEKINIHNNTSKIRSNNNDIDQITIKKDNAERLKILELSVNPFTFEKSHLKPNKLSGEEIILDCSNEICKKKIEKLNEKYFEINNELQNKNKLIEELSQKIDFYEHEKEITFNTDNNNQKYYENEIIRLNKIIEIMQEEKKSQEETYSKKNSEIELNLNNNKKNISETNVKKQFSSKKIVNLSKNSIKKIKTNKKS